MLSVRNKALGGGRRTARLSQRINKTRRPLIKSPSNESAKLLEQITEVWEWDHLPYQLLAVGACAKITRVCIGFNLVLSRNTLEAYRVASNHTVVL